MPPKDKSSKITPFPASSGEATTARTANVTKHPELIRQFIWSIVSINAHLEDINQFWAKRLGVTESQWLILMAISDLDKGTGVSGIDAAAKAHVHPQFVTAQTKILEKSGFLKRTVSSTDARFVMMFLTDKARKEIDKLAELYEQINNSLFASLDSNVFKDVTEKLARINADAKKVASRLSIET